MLDLPLKLNCCGHFTDMPDHLSERSSPADYLIIWTIAGRGFARIGSDAVDAKAGDLLTFEPAVPQRYGAVPEDPWDILWMHVEGPAAATMIDAIRAHGGPCTRLGRDELIHDRFVELVIHSGRPHFGVQGEPVWPDTEALAILGLIWRRLEQLSRVPPRPSPLDATVIQRFIHDHLTDPLTLDDLARAARLSPAHFARLFRGRFGMSPMRYVNHRRIDVACALLAESDMKLWQVAQQAGFDDPYYFSRLFRRVTGVPPSSYRERQRGR